MTLRDASHRAVDRIDLDDATMRAAVATILAGEATESEIAALSVALRMKGETPTEIAAAALAMRDASTKVAVDVGGPLVDTCGTGGDGLSTFNISTASAIVVAASGIAVAKHGNRGVSSPTGSADVLETLGVRLDLTASQVARCIEDAGIGFMFAPLFHSALRHAIPVRRSLGLRTFWNLLGPLANPAPVTHQLLGIYDGSRVSAMADALSRLGLQGGWVVHGEGGFDELAPRGETQVASIAHPADVFRVTPETFGLAPVDPNGLRGGDARVNAQIMSRVFEGEIGPPRTAVVLNAAAMIHLVGVESDPRAAAERAAAAIDRGDAARTLARWISTSKAVAA